MTNLDVLIAKAKAEPLTAAERREYVIDRVWRETLRGGGPTYAWWKIADAYDKSERERNM